MLEEAKRRGLIGQAKSEVPLWPKEYCYPHARSAWAFIRLLHTWNEAESAAQPFPDLPYLRYLVRRWVQCWRRGKPFITEKSRRLVTSWILRALELWVMGLKRCDGIITHRTHPDAAGHVWRIHWLYDDLRKRFPKWNLAKDVTHGSLEEKMLDSVVLPNGSKVEKHFEQAEGLQGSGYAFVTMEELSIYRNPGAMWAQAKFVTQASANARNGLRVAVTNSSPNPAWHECKGKVSARELLGLT